MDRAESEASRHLLVTGASGYVGRRLVRLARARGYRVTVTLRGAGRPAPSSDIEVRAFDLTRAGDAEPLPDDVDAVIHLAAILNEDSQPPDAAEDLNVSGTRRLRDAARARGVRRFIFLSSQSAAADSPTRYGRSKWTIEQLLDGAGECSVRTGLVTGGPPRGLYGVLRRLAARFPVLPIVRPAAPVYPLHVDDLCAGLLALVEQPAPPPVVRIAADEAMRFGDYVRMLARHRLGKRVRLVPIPVGPILALGRLTELVPFLPTVSRERVLGLVALRPMERGAAPAPEGAPVLRDVATVLDEEGHRRRLLTEARVLTRYVLGARAGAAMTRRYVRAVETAADRAPLDVGGTIRCWPGLLRLREPLDGHGDRLRERMGLATRIAEMTPQGALAFHKYAATSRWLAWPAIAGLLVVEGALAPLRWLGSRWKRRKRA